MRLVRNYLLLTAAFVGAPVLRAQQSDLAVTFVSQRSLKAGSTQNFWMQGGSIEFGAIAWKGLGVAVNVTGSHGDSIGTSGIPVSLVTTTFGPRYRWLAERRVSPYGEGLIGVANGFKSLFPANGAATDSSNSFAMRLGGGLDLMLTPHVAVRALEASWVRTTLPNATDNVQNSLHLGSGFVLRCGK